VTTAHKALDRVDGLGGIRDGLPARQITHEHISLVRKRHDAGGQPVSFLIGNDLGFFALHDRHHRVGSSQVDADDFLAFSHAMLLFRFMRSKSPWLTGRLIALFRSSFVIELSWLRT